MEGCPHVRQVRLGEDKSFLNPRHWACLECGTTDSVWACLLCSHVACGRSSSSHALQHFEATKHPMAVEVNLRYIHCYLCDDYVLNDTASGEIALVQSLLAQVASQRYLESTTRSGRVMKPAATFTRCESRVEEVQSIVADKRYTALRHWKSLSLSRAFNSWRTLVRNKKNQPTLPVLRKRRKLTTPGMTGLRNLGNTCYMNAVLQTLGHLVFFRECFREMGRAHESMLAAEEEEAEEEEVWGGPRRRRVLFDRQTTIECWEHLNTRPSVRPRLRRQPRQEGLSGGGTGGGGPRQREQRQQQRAGPTPPAEENSAFSLCQELHRLIRVMWSGKWAVVTPHAVLTSVWRLIPAFHGYTQQDAQEFLCELLERLQTELDVCPPSHALTLHTPHREVAVVRELLPSLFEGRLASEVIYSCGHRSKTEEPFWDLSLNFPARYQQLQSVSSDCQLEELLEAFTAREDLEETLVCSSCSAETSSERHAHGASKSLSVSFPPDVLRLHLKRFRWLGRTRQKIGSHVSFPLTLDLLPFYCRPPAPGGTVTFALGPDDLRYSLSSVIIHHGSGFASGHYTALCWNSEAESWVHYNDARVKRCSVEEVLTQQAYILFYERCRGRCWEEADGAEVSEAKRRKMG